jgi:uncharacterized membrane-anchored protein
MIMTKQKKFMLAIAVQVCIILAIVVVKVYILGTGTEVLLQIQPVDPRDPLRGDYLTFQYEISRVSFYDTENVNRYPLRNGDILYVPLFNVGKYYQGLPAKRMPPEGLYLRGTVVSGGTSDQDFTEQVVQVRYGIEDYFIPENSGVTAINEIRGGKAAADVVIDEKGNAVLKGILINDKPWPR